MEQKLQIGRLELVEIRSLWLEESGDFTPWLAANLAFLSDLLQMELEAVGTEVPVGKYSLDILAKDLNAQTASLVVIENQFGATNHDHLGKILTYAAGIDDQEEDQVGSVVWIAEVFSDEHKAALEWLNRRGDGARFFGLRLRAVKIGDSIPAPLFDPIVVPTGWPPKPPPLAQGGKGESYGQFFQPLIDLLREKHGFRGNKSAGTSSGYWFSSPIPRITYGVAFGFNGKIRAEVYIDTDSTPRNKKILDLLREIRDKIEPRIGAELAWEPSEEYRYSKIVKYGDGAVDDRETWDQVRGWMRDSIVALREGVGPHLKGAVDSAMRETG